MQLQKLKPFIIHNAERQDRYASLMAQITTQKITDYTIVDAIMLDNSITGCTASHKKCINLAIAAGYEHCCIFENDIVFTAPGAWDHFNHVFSQYLPDDYGLFNGGYYYAPEPRYVNDWIKQVKRFSSTHCIVIHESMYQFILDCPDNEYIDIWMSQGSKWHNIYLAWPMVATQLAGFSDICRKEVSYDHALADFKLYPNT